MRAFRGTPTSRNRSGQYNQKGVFRSAQEACFVCAKIGHKALVCRARHAVCYSCGQQGHIAAACKVKQQTATEGVRLQPRSRIKCWNCQKVGHLSKDCRQKQQHSDQRAPDKPYRGRGVQQPLPRGRQSASGRANSTPSTPSNAEHKNIDTVKRDAQPPRSAAQQWITSQQTKLNYEGDRPELLRIVDEVRRYWNIAIDAQVAHRKTDLARNRMAASAAKVKHRFFLRSTQAWEEIEVPSLARSDEIKRKELLLTILQKDTQLAMDRANQEVEKLLTVGGTTDAALPFTEAELQAMPAKMKTVMQSASKAPKRDATQLKTAQDAFEVEVSRWYSDLVKLAKATMEQQKIELERAEAERLAKEQVAKASEAMDVGAPPPEGRPEPRVSGRVEERPQTRSRKTKASRSAAPAQR